MANSLTSLLRAALNELRMQMLGTEVLFGFGLQGAFKETVATLSPAARLVYALALFAVVMMLAALVGAPAQHRLVERGNVSTRLLRMVSLHAQLALLFFALVLGCDVFVVSDRFLGNAPAIAFGVATFLIGMGMWVIVGLVIRRRRALPAAAPAFEVVDLHEKIRQMLTEAWIDLPGATGILAFQLSITFSPQFKRLPATLQHLHFGATGLIALAVILLVSPAAIHRLGFSRGDDVGAYRIGSGLITVAAAPLALGITADVYLAIGKIQGFSPLVGATAGAALLLLVFSWYGLPLWRRAADATAKRAT